MLGDRTKHLLEGRDTGIKFSHRYDEPPGAWFFAYGEPYFDVWKAFVHSKIPNEGREIAEWFDNAGDPNQLGYCQRRWSDSIWEIENSNMRRYADKGYFWSYK